MTTAMITAFNNQLWAAFQSYPIAWPGVPFSEPESGEWLEVAYFAGEGENIGMAYDASVVLSGFFQVTVASKSPGIISAMALANKVMTTYPRGTEIDAVRVSRTPYQMTPIYSDNIRRIPVTIPYVS